MLLCNHCINHSRITRPSLEYSENRYEIGELCDFTSRGVRFLHRLPNTGDEAGEEDTADASGMAEREFLQAQKVAGFDFLNYPVGMTA